MTVSNPELAHKVEGSLLLAHCRVTSGGKPCLWLMAELQVELQVEGSLACGSLQSYKWREALLVAHCRVTSGGKPCLWLMAEL